jgi:hypothetical protein
MGALDELGSRGLIDWTRTVVDGLGRRRCHGQLRYQLWWLARLTWSVLLGVCWWSYGGGMVLDERCHRTCATGHHVDQS